MWLGSRILNSVKKITIALFLYSISAYHQKMCRHIEAKNSVYVKPCNMIISSKERPSIAAYKNSEIRKLAFCSHINNSQKNTANSIGRQETTRVYIDWMRNICDTTNEKNKYQPTTIRIKRQTKNDSTI